MIFIETEVFTEDVKKLLDDHDYAKFQTFLALQPDYGDVIPDTGGIAESTLVSTGKGQAQWCESDLFLPHRAV